MKKEYDNMITRFNKLHESIDLSDITVDIENEIPELIDKIKKELSIITYKRRNNPKTIRIKEINGYFNKTDFKSIKLIYKTYIVINLSNNDNIKAKLSVYNNKLENNINIKINNNLIYDLDNESFSNEILIEKLIDKYKDYLLTEFKLR